jgi:hypothetical protein
MTPPVFFTDTRGYSYPVSRISMIQAGRFSSPPRPKPENWAGFLVRLSDGDPVRVWEHELETIFAATPLHLIPAQAGTYILNFDPENPPETCEAVWRVPVIAWAWTCDGVEPVTPDGINDGVSTAFVAVLMPDGSIISPGDQAWSNVADWFADKHKAAAACRAEAQA